MKRVYFIKPAGIHGPVKIGCSANPMQRLSHLTRKRRPLEIAALIEGDYVVERQFHALFRDDHIAKEWFFWTTELQSVIDRINRGSFDMAELPEPQRLPRKQIEYTPALRAKMSEDSRNMHRRHRAYAALA